jgi:hypothetical protein
VFFHTGANGERARLSRHVARINDFACDSSYFRSSNCGARFQVSLKKIAERARQQMSPLLDSRCVDERKQATTSTAGLARLRSVRHGAKSMSF